MSNSQYNYCCYGKFSINGYEHEENCYNNPLHPEFQEQLQEEEQHENGVLQGWQCQICHRSVSPYVDYCDCTEELYDVSGDDSPEPEFLKYK